jgi:hypothetical protein
MNTKFLFGFLFFLLVIVLLVLYWFVPLSTTEFSSFSKSPDEKFFNETSFQFYPNMRFADSKISYKIEDSCPLQKQDDMERAFEILSSRTPLRFFPATSYEEVSVFCDNGTKLEGGLFVAGEGGPVNITQSGEFNVISNGKILLFKESSCPEPNVALHELLHVLGFDHVNNPNGIMYNLSRCDQEMSQSTIQTLYNLYSIPSLPDLTFEDASAIMEGKYLDLNMSVRNNGLKPSSGAMIDVYADGKKIRDFELIPLDVGHGRIISLTNLFVVKLSVNQITLSINYTQDELSKENNEVKLQIKKK